MSGLTLSKNIQVNPNSLADQAGLQVGDVILKISDNNADIMRHKEAQDAIYRAGNFLEMTIQRLDNMMAWFSFTTALLF